MPRLSVGTDTQFPIPRGSLHLSNPNSKLDLPWWSPLALASSGMLLPPPLPPLPPLPRAVAAAAVAEGGGGGDEATDDADFVAAAAAVADDDDEATALLQSDNLSCRGV